MAISWSYLTHQAVANAATHGPRLSTCERLTPRVLCNSLISSAVILRVVFVLCSAWVYDVWSMHVYLYICVYIRMYLYMYVYIYVCVCLCVCYCIIILYNIMNVGRVSAEIFPVLPELLFLVPTCKILQSCCRTCHECSKVLTMI